MKEYFVDWHTRHFDELNERVPTILKGVVFELVRAKVRVDVPSGDSFEVPGPDRIKIIITGTDKQYFMDSLRHGALDDRFPIYLRDFIRRNLEIPV